MPSPRAAYGREFTAVPAIEVDAKTRDANAYARELHRGNSGPFSGKPVQIRNGMPEVKPYVYRGAGYCMTAEEAASCLS